MLFLKYTFGDNFLLVTLGDFTLKNGSDLTIIFKITKNRQSSGKIWYAVVDYKLT